MQTDGFQPGSAMRGPVLVPGSKSIAQRALLAAAFAHGTTELVGLPTSQDVVHALRVARAVGARFPSEGRPDDLFVTALLRRRGHGRLTGAPPGLDECARPWCTAQVGESGTTARLASALLALGRPAGSGAEVVPSGTLGRRRSPALFAALRAAGVGVEHATDAPDGWPVLLTSPPRVRALTLVQPTSSQEVSALLLALAAHEGGASLEVHGTIPSAPYVALTLAVLQRFGVGIELAPSSGPGGKVQRYLVGGPLRAPDDALAIEPCASSAAVALAAGCLSDGAVSVEALGAESLQPDLACIALFAAFGCEAAAEPGRLVAAGRPTRGARFDLSGSPDLAPVAAALGADVALRGLGSTELSGLGTLPGKESSRLAVLARGLGALGLRVDATEETLRIEAGASAAVGPVVLDPAGDHRMAFAFALLGLVRADVRVSNPGCVAKSWPTFWSDLEAAGARRR
jgi:3-phosphoshikimate 1-carboxyvinyltransferase